MKILIFSTPFRGNINVLIYLEKLLKEKHIIKFVITGWNNFKYSIIDQFIDINYQILYKSNLEKDNLNKNTLIRVNELTHDCIKICSDFCPHFIIYDCLSIEGFITGKVLSIPSFCSIPSMVGFNDNLVANVVEDNKGIINEINQSYKVNLINCNLKQLSESIIIPSDVNLLWSFDKIIDPDENFIKMGLRKNNIIPAGPKKIDYSINPEIKFNKNKKNIYISFGDYIMNKIIKVDQSIEIFIFNFFKNMIKILEDKKSEYDVYITLFDNFKFNINWPDNFNIYRYVNQLFMLDHADIFITHCGNNSFNEALLKKVPIIGIPFFGDQITVANKIEQLKLGVIFPLTPDFNKDNKYERKNLTPEKLLEAITLLSKRKNKYVMRILKYNWGYFDICDINALYYNYKVNWKNGDLLYGSRIDRENFIKMLNMQNDFRINYEIPFTQIFSDKRESNLLPRIIEYYICPLIDNNYYPVESSSHFEDYSQNVKEFKKWININKQYLYPINNFNDVDEENKNVISKNLSIAGINFFCLNKGYNIHFVIDSINNLNDHELKQFNYIRDNWNILSTNVSFYNCNIKFGILSKINPNLYLW